MARRGDIALAERCRESPPDSQQSWQRLSYAVY
jgi:hypothetical protein